MVVIGCYSFAAMPIAGEEQALRVAVCLQLSMSTLLGRFEGDCLVCILCVIVPYLIKNSLYPWRIHVLAVV